MTITTFTDLTSRSITLTKITKRIISTLSLSNYLPSTKRANRTLRSMIYNQFTLLVLRERPEIEGMQLLRLMKQLDRMDMTPQVMMQLLSTFLLPLNESTKQEKLLTYYLLKQTSPMPTTGESLKTL